jgi:rubrerythrin
MMTSTIDNLQTAFSGESQASRKYLAFANKAEQEGHLQIARLFRAASQAETVHATNHLRAMQGIGSTAENLKTAIAGEHYEVASMYPPFITTAEEEGHKAARTSFHRAWEAEKVHEELYTGLLGLLEAGKSDDEQYDYYVCPVCGHTHARSAPERCPVCGTAGSRFERIS